VSEWGSDGGSFVGVQQVENGQCSSVENQLQLEFGVCHRCGEVRHCLVWAECVSV
jgi:hypothetical protein